MVQQVQAVQQGAVRNRGEPRPERVEGLVKPPSGELVEPLGAEEEAADLGVLEQGVAGVGHGNLACDQHVADIGKL